jgi:biopolymer transport protein ExbD
LEGIGHGSNHAHQIYHRYSGSAIDDVLHSKGSSKMALQSGPDVQLPASFNSLRFPDADRADAVILTVTRDGQWFFGSGNRVDLVTVVEQVKDRLADRLDKMVYVRADARARYGAVAPVFSQLPAAGVDAVGLLTSGRNPQTNSCATSGLIVLIPEPPLPAASESARQSQHPQFAGVLRAPAIVPMGTSPRYPIVVQVLGGSGGVRWKINRKEVSGLNDLTAQLESLLEQRPERVGFLMADETLAFSDFVDAVDAEKGAGLDKIAVVIGNPQ